MGRKRVEYGEETKAQIIAEQKKSYPAHVYRRLLALKLKVVDGMTGKEAGKIAGLHETSINRMMGRYRKEGMEAIVGVRHHHEHRYMSRAGEEAFLRRFQLQSEAGQIIETREIHSAYEEAVGHPVTRNMIYYLLHRHKWRKVMPRSRHEKKAGEETIEAYKKITEKVKTLKKSRPKIRVINNNFVVFTTYGALLTGYNKTEKGTGGRPNEQET